MLVTLMYHRVTHTSFSSNGAEAFENHLSSISKQFSIVVPGDKLTANSRPDCCLTFDDAYFDFYHCVFPLLKKFNIRAVLAIPAGLILDDTNLSAETRLCAPYLNSMVSSQTHATLCTWQEIREMVASGLVIPACHGLTHQQITLQNIEQEVCYAKRLLQEKLHMDIETFIYPYGKMSRSINQIVNQHFQYTMRIGSALNLNWKNLHNVIYRVSGDEFWPQEKPILTPFHQLYLWTRFISNIIRFK